MEEADLVIIGAGIYGLTTAHTYHRLHPSAKILILDSAPSIGGPWAPHRTFPGLRTNNLWGMYEHPDFPMNEERFKVKRGEHIPAAKMFDYLTAFVDFASIKPFLRLQTRVEVISRDENSPGWILTCTSSSQTPKVIQAAFLVIAVGNTNAPLMPSYPQSPPFQPLVIHAKDFPQHYSAIAKPQTHTLVVGSGKSAWDIAYACATQPCSTATLLIRPGGNGPIWMTPTHVTPLRLWLEKLVHTRFFGFLSPCPWAATSGVEGWLRGFFQRTRLGRAIVGGFWSILGEDAIALNGLDAHPETKKLRPWRGAFEVGNGLSIHNYPTSFFELVREGKIKVVIDEISSLYAQNTVVLESGERMELDAVVCATGWKKGHTFRFSPGELEHDLGMPSSAPLSQQEAELVKESEEKLYTDFPYLRERNTNRTHHPASSPLPQRQDAEQQPYRLHRFLVPPSTHNIAFAGALLSLAAFPCAYIQSLWIEAYFHGTLSLPPSSPEKVLKETYRHSQYCALRGAMSYGRTLPDLVFDSLPYFDVLLGDLGIEGRRKGGVFGLGECVRSYGPEDYRGLLEGVEVRGRVRRDG